MKRTMTTIPSLKAVIILLPIVLTYISVIFSKRFANYDDDHMERSPFRFTFTSLLGLGGKRKGPASTYIDVIGAGFPRTGTNSMKYALEILGFPAYHGEDVLKHGHEDIIIRAYRDDDENAKDMLFEDIMANGFRATLDLPSNLLYRFQMGKFPEGKVILTLRDPESWYESWHQLAVALIKGYYLPGFKPLTGRYIEYVNSSFLSPTTKLSMAACSVNFNEIEFYKPFYMPWVSIPVNLNMNKEDCIALYNNHTQEVISFVEPEKLLIYKVGEGWDRLCEFLELPVPNVPFPRGNSKADFAVLATLADIYSVVYPLFICAFLELGYFSLGLGYRFLAKAKKL